MCLAWGGIDTVVVAAGVSALQPIMNIVKQGGVGHTKSVALKALDGNYIGPLVSVTTLVCMLVFSLDTTNKCHL